MHVNNKGQKLRQGCTEAEQRAWQQMMRTVYFVCNAFTS